MTASTSHFVQQPEVGIGAPLKTEVGFLITSAFEKGKKKNFGVEYALFLEDERLPTVNCGVSGKVQLIEDKGVTQNLWIWFEKGLFWGRVGYIGLSKLAPKIIPGALVERGNFLGWASLRQKGPAKLKNLEFHGYLYVEVRRLPEDVPVAFSTF